MDPLNSAVLMKRRVNFLANAGMFATPFSNWFFTNFYCIKIERYKDTGGKPINNKKAFQLATNFLTGGGCLYMAPEGGSISGRRLESLKTGAARIALNTEKENGFGLGLVILPIGLNYSDPGQFRGELHSIMGEPINVAGYKEDWEEDNIAAVRKLTAVLEKRMRPLLINTEDAEEEGLLAQAEIILQNEKALEGQTKFERSKAVSEKMQQWKKYEQGIHVAFKEKITEYFQKLEASRLSDAAVKGKEKAPLLLMVLTFPIFLLGYLLFFLPTFFTKKLSDRLATDPVWIPTYKTLGGLILFPIIFTLQYWVLKKCLSNVWEVEGWFKWAYMASILPAGMVAEWFIGKWRLFQANWNFRRFDQQKPAEKEEILARRKTALQHLAE